MEEEEHKAWVEPDNVEGIPIQDPVFTASASWKTDKTGINKIDEIHCANLTGLEGDRLESIHTWLQGILDSWPNVPEEEK